MFNWKFLFLVVFTAAFSVSAITFAKESTKPCHNDVQKFCQNQDKGRGGKFKCLQEHRSELSSECVVHLDEKQRKRDALKQACQNDIDKHCSGKEGREQMRCLHDQKDSLSKECSQSLSQMKRRKLQKRLASCKEDIKAQCPDIQDKKEMIRCLESKKSALTDACSKDLDRMLAMRQLKTICEDDLKKFCNEIRPGKGAMQECLNQNEKSLTDACKDQLSKTNTMKNAES